MPIESSDNDTDVQHLMRFFPEGRRILLLQ